jgi:hypothetical protein
MGMVIVIVALDLVRRRIEGSDGALGGVNGGHG